MIRELLDWKVASTLILVGLATTNGPLLITNSEEVARPRNNSTPPNSNQPNYYVLLNTSDSAFQEKYLNFNDYKLTEFISTRGGLKDHIINSIKKLQEMFTNIDIKVTLYTDPEESFSQVCITIISSDEDSFGKFNEFIENFASEKSEFLIDLVYDIKVA